MQRCSRTSWQWSLRRRFPVRCNILDSGVSQGSLPVIRFLHRALHQDPPLRCSTRPASNRRTRSSHHFAIQATCRTRTKAVDVMHKYCRARQRCRASGQPANMVVVAPEGSAAIRDGASLFVSAPLHVKAVFQSACVLFSTVLQLCLSFLLAITALATCNPDARQNMHCRRGWRC